MNIKHHYGASSDQPVYRSNAANTWGENSKHFRFDTYGSCPPNVNKWEPRYFGAAGVMGETDDVDVLIEAIEATNKEGKTALICDTLYHELIAILKLRELCNVKT